MERWPPPQADASLPSYYCCKCSQGIKLDPSLLDAAPYDEAIGIILNQGSSKIPKLEIPPPASGKENVSTAPVSALPPQVAALRTERKLAAIKSSIPIQDSFVMLSKSQVSLLQLPAGGRGADEQQRGSLSHRLKTAGKLFDLLSEATEVDHPLCEDCADELMMRLEKRVHESRKEKQAYESYLETLMDGEEEAAKSAVTDADVLALKETERDALESLKALKTEEAALNDELAAVQAELQELETLKVSYWQEVNEYESELQNYKNEHESVKLLHAYASEQLEGLKKTNVYNDTFRIWHEDLFGTINGLRLGRLPTQPVDWTEINAAMGQALLLLDTLANKLRFTFKGYKLVPMGSLSRLEKTDGDKGTLELHGSGELMKGMLFWNRRFDNGLVAFLNCLQQIGDYAEQQDSKFRLPYRISKDKIGETSIKMQFNQDEAWTKALKYMLIDLKWILAFCCTRP
ncbi:autophagy protein Apg6-domain-containing protein [Powellomyces hirtus]|nr:autophagy protein Apg6-domain-containing protein [Powellomyces hirtus]